MTNIVQWILRYFSRGFLLTAGLMWMTYTLAMQDKFTLQVSTIVLAVLGYVWKEIQVAKNGK